MATLAAGDPLTSSITSAHLSSIPEDDEVLVLNADCAPFIALSTITWHGTQPNVENHVTKKPIYSVIYLNLIWMRMLKTHTWNMNIKKVAERSIRGGTWCYRRLGAKKHWMSLVWSLACCLAACMCVWMCWLPVWIKQWMACIEQARTCSIVALGL